MQGGCKYFRNPVEFAETAFNPHRDERFRKFLIIWKSMVREMLSNHLFGPCFATLNAYSECAEGEARMGILILKVLVTWALVAMVTGLSLGAAIRRGERVRKDEFLSRVFASLDTLQAYRS
jgi:hypothetical protein